MQKFIKILREEYGHDIDEDGWFNFTKWHIGDIQEAMIKNNIKPTDKNVKIFFEELYEETQSKIAQRGMQVLKNSLEFNKNIFE
jgi:sRNA-binding carbon storage regulator CsrA